MSGRVRSLLLGVATLICLASLHASLTEPDPGKFSLAKPGATGKADIRAAETHSFAAAAFRSSSIAY